MSGVAQQYDDDGYLHPVAYWSKTFNPAQATIVQQTENV